MKVVVSSLNRYHSIELALQLLQRGLLKRLYTGYPSWKIEADLGSYTTSFPWLLIPLMMLYRYGFTLAADSLAEFASNTFDKQVSRRFSEFDILVAQSQFGLHSILCAKKQGLKAVCLRGSAHILYQDQILKEEFELQGVAYKAIAPWAIDKELQEYDAVDMIETISTFAYETFLEQGIAKEKLFLNPLGVELSLYHPIKKVDNVFRVLYVGTLSLQKGIPYLLEALANLKLPNFELMLVGSMTDEITNTLSRYVNGFKYVGVVPRYELSNYYSQASVFVLPSIQDGFGMVLTQAMACAVPVIATTNSGGRDLITEGVEGFIIPIRSPEAIREKVLELYHNPDLRDKMAQAALQRVQSVGGWDEYGDRSIQAYKRLLE